MPFELRLDHDLGSEVRRTITEQVAAALRELDGKPSDLDVHRVRKCLKKARSALRLLVPASSRKALRAEHDAIRQAAQLLSASRDGEVRRRILTDLHEESELDPSTAEKVAAPTKRDRTAAFRLLDGVMERSDDWLVRRIKPRDLAAVTASRYATGRVELAQAMVDPDPELLHELRKRVKDVWYHHRLLAGAWPEVLVPFGEAAHMMSEHLGDEHDLVVTGEHLHSEGHPHLKRLEKKIAARRLDFQRRAFDIGQRLYAEEPDAYEHRILALIKAARRG